MSKHRVPEFDGTSDVDSWLKTYTDIIAAKQVHWGKDEGAILANALLEFKLALRGKLIRWYDNLDPKTLKSIDVVKEALREFCFKPGMTFEYYEQALHFSQEKGKSVDDYYVDKVYFFKKGNITDVVVQANLFLSGLDPRIKAKIEDKDDKKRDTLEKIYKLAMRFERMLNLEKDGDDAIVTKAEHDSQYVDMLKKFNDLEKKCKDYEKEIRNLKSHPNNRKPCGQRYYGNTVTRNVPKKYTPPPKPIPNTNTSSSTPKCKHCGKIGHWSARSPQCPRHDPNFQRRKFDNKNGVFDSYSEFKRVPELPPVESRFTVIDEHPEDSDVDLDTVSVLEKNVQNVDNAISDNFIVIDDTLVTECSQNLRRIWLHSELKCTVDRKKEILLTKRYWLTRVRRFRSLPKNSSKP